MKNKKIGTNIFLVGGLLLGITSSLFALGSEGSVHKKTTTTYNMVGGCSLPAYPFNTTAGQQCSGSCQETKTVKVECQPGTGNGCTDSTTTTNVGTPSNCGKTYWKLSTGTVECDPCPKPTNSDS